jgi:hypothetical protein
MKRDLRINYGNLESFCGVLVAYQDALHTMRDAIKNAHVLLAGLSGEAFDALSQEKDEIISALDTFDEHLTATKDLLSWYITDMTGYIRPLGKAWATQTDSNDTYWNIQQMSSGVVTQNPWVTYDASDSNKYCYNQGITVQINAVKTALRAKIADRINELWRLHGVIVDYENTDDAYAEKALTLWRSYAGFWEQGKDNFELAGSVYFDLSSGFCNGLADLFVGLGESICGTLQYLDSGMSIGLCTLTGQVPPASASEYFNNTNDTIASLIADPFLIVAGLGQGISDTVDEKGIVYTIGYFIPEAIGLKGLSKVGKVGALGQKVPRLSGDKLDIDVKKPSDSVPSPKVDKPASGIGNYPELIKSYPVLQRSGVLGNKTLTNITGLGTINYVSPSKGFLEALGDFYSLPLSNVRSYPGNRLVGHLSDNTTVNVRPTSESGLPTLEIRNPVVRQSVKIRY